MENREIVYPTENPLLKGPDLISPEKVREQNIETFFISSLREEDIVSGIKTANRFLWLSISTHCLAN